MFEVVLLATYFAVMPVAAFLSGRYLKQYKMDVCLPIIAFWPAVVALVIIYGVVWILTVTPYEIGQKNRKEK